MLSSAPAHSAAERTHNQLACEHRSSATIVIHRRRPARKRTSTMCRSSWIKCWARATVASISAARSEDCSGSPPLLTAPCVESSVVRPSSITALASVYSSCSLLR